MTERVLTLYGHRFCSLCAEMQLGLEQLRPRLGFELELVDITDDPVLEQRFGEKVPVLMCGEREVCYHFLDEAALRRCFAPSPSRERAPIS